jgi:hypothetical protein
MPLIAGVIRFRKLPVSYYPLIYLLFIGTVNEFVSYIFFYNSSNAVPVNIYFLLEFLLFSWQFRSWKNILTKNKWYHALLIIMVLLWIFENVVLGRIIVFSPIFQVSYSLVLVLLAVNQLNWLVVNEQGNIIADARFIICIAVIIYFSYKVLTEIFYHYAPSNLMKNNIFDVQSYCNVGYNVLLTIAILCIPTKSNFIRLSR